MKWWERGMARGYEVVRSELRPTSRQQYGTWLKLHPFTTLDGRDVCPAYEVEHIYQA
jgi:hypothetical protein